MMPWARRCSTPWFMYPLFQRVRKAVPGTDILLGVACATATTCEAVGNGPEPPCCTGGYKRGLVVAITNGVPGPVQTVPSANTLVGVACPTAATCQAVGGAYGERGDSTGGLVVPIIKGTPGAGQTIPSIPSLLPLHGGQLDGVACPSTTTCIAVGYHPYPQPAGISVRW
jgi:hypothetical protein